jgi:hypothetical protein
MASSVGWGYGDHVTGQIELLEAEGLIAPLEATE